MDSCLEDVGQRPPGESLFRVFTQISPKERMAEFMNKIRTDMNIDSTVRGVKKIMEKLSVFIDSVIRDCREQLPPEKFESSVEADIIVPRFLSELSK
jgi:hypothetical protein